MIFPLIRPVYSAPYALQCRSALCGHALSSLVLSPSNIALCTGKQAHGRLA
jgi:hypothetical protein